MTDRTAPNVSANPSMPRRGSTQGATARAPRWWPDRDVALAAIALAAVLVVFFDFAASF